MKKITSFALCLILSILLLSACSNNGSSESTSSEVIEEPQIWTTETNTPINIDPSLITDDKYQYIPLGANEYVYKVTNTSSMRSHRFAPMNGSITVTLDLITSLYSKYNTSDFTGIALWETNGEDMIYLQTIYSPTIFSVEDGGTASQNTIFTYTFNGLDNSKTYRLLFTPERDTLTGFIKITNATEIADIIIAESEVVAE